MKDNFNLNITPGTTRKRLLEYYPKISQTKKENKKKEMAFQQEDQVRELAAEGKSQKEIALALGISQGFVSRILEKIGLESSKIKETRIINKFKDIPIQKLKDWFHETGNETSFRKKCQLFGIIVTKNEVNFVLEKVLQVNRCKTCGEKITYHNRFCCNCMTGEVAKLTFEEKSTKQIANILKIPTYSVYSFRRKAVEIGFLEKCQKRKLNTNLISNQVASLVKEGKSIKHIADQLKISANSVYRYRKKAIENGLLEKYQRKLGMNMATNQVAFLVKEGNTIKQIADMLGISIYTVSSYRKKAVENGLLEK